MIDPRSLKFDLDVVPMCDDSLVLDLELDMVTAVFYVAPHETRK